METAAVALEARLPSRQVIVPPALVMTPAVELEAEAIKPAPAGSVWVSVALTAVAGPRFVMRTRLVKG